MVPSTGLSLGTLKGELSPRGLRALGEAHEVSQNSFCARLVVFSTIPARGPAPPEEEVPKIEVGDKMEIRV